MPTQKTRAQLRNLFLSGSKPTSGDFADWIESSLNALEDGIFTQPGDDDPLKIVAKGENANLLDMYVDAAHFWRFDTQPSTTSSGFNLSYDGVTKTFVETATGNLGLGTVDPEHKLDALGNIRAFGGRLIAGDDGTDTIELGHATDGDAFLDVKGAGGLTIRNDGVDQLTVTSAGNLGIGTSSPGAKLAINGGVHIGGDSDPGDNNLQVDGNTFFGTSTRQMLNLWDTSYGIGIQDNTMYFRTGDQFAWYKSGSHNDNAFNGGGGAARMVINSSGNVGINTTSPGYKLDVNGNMKISSSLSFGASTRQMINLYDTRYGIGVQASCLYFRSDSHFCWFTGGSHSNATLSGGTWQMYLANNGMLVTRATGGVISDASLKKDVTAIDDGLSKIMKLKPCRFRWIDSPDQSLNTGFLAQEVEKVLPDSVKTVGEHKSVAYGDFSVLAIAGIQEQQAQIDALRARIDALEAAS